MCVLDYSYLVVVSSSVGRLVIWADGAREVVRGGSRAQRLGGGVRVGWCARVWVG